VTLARTAKANALDQPLLDALEAARDAIDRDPGCKVMLLASASPKAFCAGGDIAAWGALSPRQMATRWIRDGHRIFDRLAGLRQPTIAVIEGIAYGGGLELAACCDLRVAGEGARFALPETTVATAPGWAGRCACPAHRPGATKRLASPARRRGPTLAWGWSTRSRAGGRSPRRWPGGDMPLRAVGATRQADDRRQVRPVGGGARLDGGAVTLPARMPPRPAPLPERGNPFDEAAQCGRPELGAATRPNRVPSQRGD
jgi:hypothetical protein